MSNCQVFSLVSCSTLPLPIPHSLFLSFPRAVPAVLAPGYAGRSLAGRADNPLFPLRRLVVTLGIPSELLRKSPLRIEFPDFS